MDLFANVLLPEVVSTIVYFLLGLVLFILSFLIIELITPFSVNEELTKNKNVAVGIVMGAFIIGLAILLSGVIRS